MEKITTTTLRVYQCRQDCDNAFEEFISNSDKEVTKVFYRDSTVIVSGNRIEFCYFNTPELFKMLYLPRQWG